MFLFLIHVIFMVKLKHFYFDPSPPTISYLEYHTYVFILIIHPTIPKNCFGHLFAGDGYEEGRDGVGFPQAEPRTRRVAILRGGIGRRAPGRNRVHRRRSNVKSDFRPPSRHDHV